MIATAAHIGFLGPLSRKSGQDFGWAFSSGDFGCYLGYERLVDLVRSSIKPIRNISGPRNPFQILGSGVSPVFVLMMNGIKTVGIRDKGLGNKSMNQKGFGGTVPSKFDFRVAAGGTKFSNSGSDVTVPSVTIVDGSRKACDAAQVAYLVEPLVPQDIAPLLSFKVLHNRGQFGEKFENNLFDVNHLSFSAVLDTEVGDKISIVSGSLKNLRADSTGSSVQSVRCDPAAAPNSGVTGNLVADVAGDWLPYLARLVKQGLCYIWEKFVNLASHIDAQPHSHAEQVSAPSVERKGLTTRVSNLPLVRYQVVRGFWDRKPSGFDHFSTLGAGCSLATHTGLCGECQVANNSAISMAGGASCP